MTTTMAKSYPAAMNIVEMRESASRASSSPASRVDADRSRQPRAPEGDYCKFFSFIRQVGDGTYGRTWLAVDKRTNRRVLAKLIRRTENNRKSFEAEWKLSRLFSCHPSIVQTYEEAFENDNHRMLIQEYADGGDLCSAIKSGVGLSQVRVRRYLGQIASALQHVHNCGYVHRDIKPENMVLVNVPCEEDSYRRQMGLTMTHAKLIDFGMACKIGTAIMPAKITIPYLAPEVCASSTQEPTVMASPSMDVWGLGVTLFTMLTGMFPWKKACMTDSNYAAFVHWQEVDAEWVPPMFERFSWQLLELFRKMLAVNPEERVSAQHVLGYLDLPWFYCVGDEGTAPSSRGCSSMSVDSGISNTSLLSCDSGLVGSSECILEDAGSPPPCRQTELKN
ncbi:serine/threonine-protein kinase SBK1-like [Sycon ciliatum]|uniref:serine/threonine-protein kinase SBK1-like n=1 Tax=Sycon ciliatum TaxID=27933 RepID=UPI0031F71D42